MTFHRDNLFLVLCSRYKYCISNWGLFRINLGFGDCKLRKYEYYMAQTERKEKAEKVQSGFPLFVCSSGRGRGSIKVCYSLFFSVWCQMFFGDLDDLV